MSTNGQTSIAAVIKKHEADLLSNWVAEQAAANTDGQGQIKQGQLREQCAEFLRLFQDAIRTNNGTDISRTSGRASGTCSATCPAPAGNRASRLLRRPRLSSPSSGRCFGALRRELGKDTEALAEETWRATELLDKLGLLTTEVHQKAREEVIARQQQDMFELSTPVVRLWEGILALPLIGTLDSARTQVVMEALLQKIVDTGSFVAIIDITGVPTVDTLVAQHLLKTVTAARLMGAECIISGIRPHIAHTIVHLGVDLGDVITKASMADAFAIALRAGTSSSAVPRGGPGEELTWNAFPFCAWVRSCWRRSRWICTTAWP